MIEGIKGLFFRCTRMQPRFIKIFDRVVIEGKTKTYGELETCLFMSVRIVLICQNIYFLQFCKNLLDMFFCCTILQRQILQHLKRVKLEFDILVKLSCHFFMILKNLRTNLFQFSHQLFYDFVL